ncbi:MAG: serine/threonine-protein kinase [Polyangiales bacterium]
MSKCSVDGRRVVTLAAFAAGGGDPLLGQTMAGRYTLVSRLGAGNMGTVYRAEQAPLNREVAFKVLRKDLGRDPETVVRFEREAVMLSQLKHPNTVTVLDAGRTEEGQLFLAMELLEGEMLSTRLKRVGWLGVDEALRVAMGVLRSLDEAHAKGIIHRDLKPDNIFLAHVHGRPDEAEVVKVVDFGIAKIRDGDRPHGLDPLKTAEGTVFGTPRYMSPEQAQGKALDGRSDLYAVGLLLFHMLSGDPPFLEDDAVVVMAHHIKTVPPRLRTVVPSREIPEELEALVARGLAKDPALRPQTAQEFLAMLEAVRDGRRATPAPGVVPPATSTFPPTVSAPLGARGSLSPRSPPR